MKHPSDPQALLDAIRGELDQGVDRLDGETLSKLRRLRARVLEGRPRARVARFLIPGGLIVTACLLLLIFGFLPRQPDREDPMIEDLDLISTQESFEFYEDLEFYEWLEEHA